MICRSIEDVYAAADADSLDEPVRSQEWADRIALILAASGSSLAAREPITA
jgi:hypothetical protein